MTKVGEEMRLQQSELEDIRVEVCENASLTKRGSHCFMTDTLLGKNLSWE